MVGFYPGRIDSPGQQAGNLINWIYKMHKIRKLIFAGFFAVLAVISSAALAQINATQTGVGATASGDMSTADGAFSIAGTTNLVGVNPLFITPTYSYGRQTAVGVAAMSWGAGDTTVGTGSMAISQPALGSITPATAMGNNASAWGGYSVAIGASATAGGATIGAVPSTNLSVTGATAIGAQANASGLNSTAIGFGAAAPATNSVAIGAGSAATQANSVDVGGRTITSVAAGVNPSDAANTGQVNTVAALANTAQATATTAQNTASAAQATATTALNVANQLQGTIEQNRRIAAAGSATALAMSSARPASLAPGETSVGVGLGAFDGQSALAITVNHVVKMDNPENHAFKEVTVQGGFGTGSVGGMGVSAGVAFKF